MKTSFAFGNIRNRPLMRRRFVLQDIKQLMSMVRGRYRVVMGCEIGPRIYNLIWRRQAKRRGLTTFFEKQSVQMSVDLDHFDVHWAEVRKMHGGKRMTSPARKTATVAGAKADGTKEAYQVSHKVSGAWNAKKKRNKLWRQARWVEHVDKDRAWIKEIVDIHQYNLIKSEDTNNIELVEYHPRQVVIKKAGIVQAVAIPAPGYRAQVTGKDADDPRHSDHPFIEGDVEFVRI